jgi:hypothetical protein
MWLFAKLCCLDIDSSVVSYETNAPPIKLKSIVSKDFSEVAGLRLGIEAGC